MAAAGAAGGAGSGAGVAAIAGSGQPSRPVSNFKTEHVPSRKRNSFVAGLDSSPISNESADYDAVDLDNQQDEEKRHPVKRACNECRQQKVGPA